MRVASPLPTVFQQEPSSPGRMLRGEQYRVIAAFDDTDGDKHPVGEQWTFIGSWFSKFDDNVTLFVYISGGENRQFSLHWTPDSQAHVIENILTYVSRIS